MILRWIYPAGLSWEEGSQLQKLSPNCADYFETSDLKVGYRSKVLF